LLGEGVYFDIGRTGIGDAQAVGLLEAVVAAEGEPARGEEGVDFVICGIATANERLADDEFRAGVCGADRFEPDVVAPEEMLRTRLFR
jgi:hypothetical protein